MVLIMKLFYYHVHFFFQHTSCKQINGDDPPATSKCLIIVVGIMNLEKPRDCNATLNLSKLAPTLEVNDLGSTGTNSQH